MKTKILLFSLITTLCAVSCTYPVGPGLPPEPSVEIIKFKRPEYKDYIMTSSMSKTARALKMATSGFVLPDTVLNLYGQSPYIELVDNYLLIDWKWGRIYYNNNDGIIKEKWTELKDIKTVWPLDQLYVDYPVAEAYYVYVDKIKEYNGGYLEHDEVAPFMRVEDATPLFEEQKEWVMYWLEETDSAFIEYAEILSRMINEGKLEKYGSKTKLRKN